MNENEIKSTIYEFLVDNFLFGKPFTINDDESLLENGIIDSAGVLSLVVFLEDEFSISVEDDEIDPENLDSVENLVKFILSKS